MAFDFKFPDVGEGTTEGTLVKWLVKEGDTIKADQAIAEIETDKAVVEIPSPKAGVVLKLYGKVGEVIKVGSVLATIGEKGESAGSIPAPASAPVPSAKSETKSAKTPATGKASTPAAPASSTGKILATPSTRQLARKLKVDLAKVKGSGPNGRITDEDVQNAGALKGAVDSNASPAAARTQMPEETIEDFPGLPPSRSTMETAQGTHTLSPLSQTPSSKALKSGGEEERKPLKGLRKVISDHMVKSMFTSVQVTHMDEVDVTALVKLREKEKAKLAKKNIRLTYLAFIVKACASALKNHPWMNASIDDATQEVVYKKYYHMGIAVDTEDGLIVPVLRDVDKKSIEQIAKEMQELAEKTRARKTTMEDLKGSTFTITNIGSLGGTYATPVINWPEVGILGVGKIQELPRVRNGKIVPRHIMTVSLTFDHRLVDGAQAVRFCNEVLQHLEDPGLFLVDVV